LKEIKKMDWSIIVIIIQLIFLEGILSIDNAAILGAMVTRLPEHEPIPWPKSLAKFGHIFDKALGPQRIAALRVGLIGAYAGRGIMLLLASIIVQNPWLKAIGAAYLLQLALDDLGAPGHEGSEGDSLRSVKQSGFWSTVLSVELMDLAFSLDNVVAAVSLSDHILIVMLGVAIGILVMRFAAGIFSYVVEREPILKPAAYVLVLNIGIELLLEEFAHIEFSDWARFAISITTIVLALAYAHLPFMKVFRPLLIWISQGFALVSAFVAWILLPLKTLFSILSKALRRSNPKLES
jgi:tellurite resistance protein TerC